MAKMINTKLDSGILKFSFTDSDGDEVASFRLNPTDIRLAERCEKISDYFHQIGKTTGETSTEQISAMEAEIEEKICYLLGYDAKPTLFGLLSATTILPSGDIFATLILDAISAAIKPEVEKRAKKMRKAVEKYTDKYDSGVSAS